VLYTIPVGSNPTGASLTLERKKDIYSIAREFELLILEDDPYYWMQFSSQRTPSFLSMDVDGRVLRFDSFSKLLSSGLRVGFVTGPPALIERIELHQQASVLHSSGVSQALVSGLFDQWAAANGGSIHAGFNLHCQGIADYYRERRDFFLASADRHLSGLCEWSAPSAGMFVWMKLPVEDADAFIKSKARKAKVLLVPGQSFDPHDRPSSWARAAYSTATLPEIDEALRRLAELLAEETKE
jgi:kynurenine/2-aminoadipate aminotransferase